MVLVGSNEKHTTTGLVEHYIVIVKTVMLKMHTDTVAIMTIGSSVAMMEACVATNCLCIHDGIALAIGVTGQLPRDYPELGNTSPTNDALLPGEACDDAILIRQIAKISTLQSVMERRLAAAEHTRPQKIDLEKLKPGLQADLWHQP